MFFKKELIIDIPLSEVKKGHPPAVGLLIDQHGPRGAVKVRAAPKGNFDGPSGHVTKKQDDGKAHFYLDKQDSRFAALRMTDTKEFLRTPL